MLRIHAPLLCYSVSNPAMEEALIEMPIMRHFTVIELISDRIPDKTTIFTYRQLLEKQGLCEHNFDIVNRSLMLGA